MINSYRVLRNELRKFIEDKMIKDFMCLCVNDLCAREYLGVASIIRIKIWGCETFVVRMTDEG